MTERTNEMYRNIIYVMNYLYKLPKKQRKDLEVYEIHDVICYVFNEYIKLKGINDKKEITDQMIKEMRSISTYDEIDTSQISKLSRHDINIVRNYIGETSDDGLDAIYALDKLDKMSRNCIID
jgi:hypothetical protein